MDRRWAIPGFEPRSLKPLPIRLGTIPSIPKGRIDDGITEHCSGAAVQRARASIDRVIGRALCVGDGERPVGCRSGRGGLPGEHYRTVKVGVRLARCRWASRVLIG